MSCEEGGYCASKKEREGREWSQRDDQEEVG
jgi:hypothetical protein